jgi:transposase
MLTFVGRRIFLVPGATDMRRSFNGLSGFARELLSATPESRDLFVFCNAGHNRLKVLVYDESGRKRSPRTNARGRSSPGS